MIKYINTKVMGKRIKHQRKYHSKQQNTNSKTVLELGVHLKKNLKLVARNWQLHCCMQSVKGMTHQLNYKP